jgi:5-formyltetrahydrofolate cyclo-ligase
VPRAASWSGIPEPAGGRRLETGGHGAIVFVPLVAWSPSGCRLGRGAGWYDRLLSCLGTGAVTVGLGYEVQCYDHLPRAPWDVDLNYIVTEERLMRCAEAGRANIGGMRD